MTTAGVGLEVRSGVRRNSFPELASVSRFSPNRTTNITTRFQLATRRTSLAVVSITVSRNYAAVKT